MAFMLFFALLPLFLLVVNTGLCLHAELLFTSTFWYLRVSFLFLLLPNLLSWTCCWVSCAAVPLFCLYWDGAGSHFSCRFGAAADLLYLPRGWLRSFPCRSALSAFFSTTARRANRLSSLLPLTGRDTQVACPR